MTKRIQTKRQQSRMRPDDGFVLIVVVVMLAVAALILARFANTSQRVASAAIEEEKDLRNRWAVSSIRRFSLNAADDLMNRQMGAPSSDPNRRFSTLWKDIQLGGQTWRVIVSDESSKVNLHHLARESNEAKTRQTAQVLLSKKHPVSLAAKLETAKANHSARWDDWIDCQTTDRWVASRQIAEATQSVTLWGNGRLNVCRSDAETIDTLWKHLFGRAAPSELHELRSQQPPPNARNLIGALALSDSQLFPAHQWITTESECYSVWVFCQTDRRVRPSLYVEWGGGDVAMEHRGYEY